MNEQELQILKRGILDIGRLARKLQNATLPIPHGWGYINKFDI